MHLKKNANNGVSSAGFTYNEMQTEDAYSSLSFIRSQDSMEWERTLGAMLLFSNTCPFFDSQDVASRTPGGGTSGNTTSGNPTSGVSTRNPASTSGTSSEPPSSSSTSLTSS